MCQRALALYKKTVERPSQQSVRRAKQLADCHIHPWMLDDAEASERSGSSSSLIAKLQNFRPAQSVLEIHDGVLGVERDVVSVWESMCVHLAVCVCVFV